MKPYKQNDWLWEQTRATVFLRSDAAATTFFAARLVRLLFEGSVYFFGKPTDINNGWIRYVRVIQWWLLDAVSCKLSLSVLLPAVEMSHTTRTCSSPMTVIRSYSHTCVCAAFCTCDYYSKVAFISLRAPDLCALFEGGVYSKKYGIWPFICRNGVILINNQP